MNKDKNQKRIAVALLALSLVASSFCVKNAKAEEYNSSFTGEEIDETYIMNDYTEESHYEECDDSDPRSRPQEVRLVQCPGGVPVCNHSDCCLCRSSIYGDDPVMIIPFCGAEHRIFQYERVFPEPPEPSGGFLH